MATLIKSFFKDNVFLHKYSFTKIQSVNTNICEHCVKRGVHQYRNTIPWKNTIEFSDYLIKNVAYHDNGLLVLNKPYGVTFSRDGVSDRGFANKIPDPEELVFKKQIKTKTKNIEKAFCTSGVVSDSLTLVDCLPYLKKHFGYDKLHIGRIPGKLVSGVAVLTTSKELVESINRSRLHLPTGKDRYLAVVVGVPLHSQGTIKLAFKLESDPKKGKKAVLLREWSNKAYKRGEVYIGTFHYQTICTGYNDLTSLVEVAVDTRRYNAYRLFLTEYLLSPVLGDNLFGSRVQTVMGVPTTIHHFSDAASVPQRLNNEIYNLLELSSGDANLIPVHVHLSETLLPRFLKNNKSLLLTAPPPPHFQWACEKLGLFMKLKQNRISCV